MEYTIETELNQNGSYSPKHNSKNITNYEQSDLDWIEKNPQGALGILQNAHVINNELILIGKNVIQNINRVNNQMQYLENVNQRYYNVQNNYYNIEYNEYSKYKNLLDAQNSLLNNINEKNYPYGLWRYNDNFYYRASPQSKLCIGNAEKISKEISSRYPMNIHIVDDLNNIPNNIKEMKFDTVFISKKDTLLIEGEIIEPNKPYEIFQDSDGEFYRNLIINTEFLKKRFQNFHLNPNNATKTKVFIQKISTYNDSKFLLNRLGKSFKSLKSENIIVMVGHKNVSEDIFCNRVIKPMIHPENYITITDDILKEKSIAEILKGKIFIYVTHIPENQELRKKLKELFIQVSINKYFYMENQKVNTYAQIIVTLDKEDNFIKEFEHLSNIFYINPLEEILSEMNEINDVSLIGNIEASLMNFAEELCVIGDQQGYNNYTDNNLSTGNKRFLDELEEVSEITNLESETGLPILDPYSDSYENIIKNFKRFKHTYYISNQGFGKTLLMITQIHRDILLNDCSIVVLDPHGDLAADLLKTIDDKERLVYIDLYLDSMRMPTINLFDVVDNKDEDSIYSVTQLIMSVFKNISSEDKLNDLMENVAENCISVMLREGGGSFWELFQFLGGNGSKDWLKLGKNSPKELEAYYFNYEFDNESQTRAAVKRRLGKLIRDPKFSAFMNKKSTLNLEQLVNTKGKIIIFNIASGRMPNTYQYYMKFLIGYLQLIALKRVSIPNIDDRTYTQVYLDEFHLFLDKSNNLEEILTGARKYRMFLNFAHQTIAQIENSNLREIVTTIPTRYFIGNIANKSVEILNKAMNTKLENTENQIPGEFYYKEDNNEPYKIQNTDRFLGDKVNISAEKLKENIDYQLISYYKDSNSNKTSEPTKNDINEMIQQFKADLISKNLAETSCLYKINNSAPERFKEIKADFEFLTIKDKEYKPRIRQKEISTIFKLAFELDYTFDNTKVIQMLKDEKNKKDMFNQSSSGTRTAEFTSKGKTLTEQYYYY